MSLRSCSACWRCGLNGRTMVATEYLGSRFALLPHTCPICRTEYCIPDGFAGEVSACRNCGTSMQVPEAQTTTAAGAVHEQPQGDWPNPGGSVAVTTYLRQAKPHRRSLWIALGLAVLVVGSGAVARWLLSPATAPMGDGMLYLPSSTRFLALVRVDQLRDSATWTDLESGLPGLKNSMDDLGMTGVNLDDIDEITIGWTMSGTEEPLTIIKTKRDITIEDLKMHEEFATFTESKVGKHRMYEGLVMNRQRGASAYCLPEARILLLGHSYLLRPVLVRDERPTLVGDMQDRINEVDFSRPLTFALNLKGLSLRSKSSGIRLQDYPGPLDGVTGKLEPGSPSQVEFTFVSERVPEDQLYEVIEDKLRDMRFRMSANRRLARALDCVQLSVENNKVRATAPLPSATIMMQAFGAYEQ